MGLYYTAYALLGVSFDLPTERTVTKVPSCPHPEREGHAFCPVCGTRNQEREVVTETDHYETMQALERSLGRDWMLVFPDECQPRRYLGVGVRTGVRDGKPHLEVRPLPSHEEILAGCRRLLEPLGAWQGAEATYGLHCLVGAS